MIPVNLYCSDSKKVLKIHVADHAEAMRLIEYVSLTWQSTSLFSAIECARTAEAHVAMVNFVAVRDLGFFLQIYLPESEEHAGAWFNSTQPGAEPPYFQMDYDGTPDELDWFEAPFCPGLYFSTSVLVSASKLRKLLKEAARSISNGKQPSDEWLMLDL